jgi:hypothetical protein
VITIECQTLFDITATGITGHYNSSRKPFLESDQWNRARNQQRNWETLQQIISLRTQILNLTLPIKDKDCWTFKFSSETTDVFGSSENPTELLYQDAQGVPMLKGLDNIPNIESTLITGGKIQNIWFKIVDINTELKD